MDPVPIDVETAEAALEILLPALASLLEAALDSCASIDAPRRLEFVAGLAEDAAALARAGMVIARRASPPT